MQRRLDGWLPASPALIISLLLLLQRRSNIDILVFMSLGSFLVYSMTLAISNMFTRAVYFAPIVTRCRGLLSSAMYMSASNVGTEYMANI